MEYNPQSRKWQLTINNPDNYGITPDTIRLILSVFSLAYFCFAYEIGELGTKHVHIFLYSESAIRFSTLKNRFPTAHIEKCYGSCSQNRDYITKQGTWSDTDKAGTSIADSFYESGECPSDKKEKYPKMQQLIDDIDSGMTTEAIVRSSPNLALKLEQIELLSHRLLTEKYKKEFRSVEVIYLYGDTGTGKTYSVYERHGIENICRITSYTPLNALFDSYTNQDVLVFDEFHSQIPLPSLLTFLDIYPVELPARYHTRTACYQIVYIISNIPLNMQYEKEQLNDAKTWQAFMRRISHYRHQTSFDFFEEAEIIGGYNDKLHT